MDLTLSIPDDLAGRLGASGDLSRRALEAFALEEYKNERISKAELRHLLGIRSRYELDGFLKAHGVWIEYDMEDFRREQEALDRLGV
jgi:capsule polysaccharide export protein KpsE/RkpR